MLDNNTVYFLNIIWTYCTCMYYVSEINEYYYYIIIYLQYICKIHNLFVNSVVAKNVLAYNESYHQQGTSHSLTSVFCESERN